METDLQMCFTENQKLKNRLDYLHLILKASDLYQELKAPKNNYCKKCEQLKRTITTEDKEVSCQLSDAASVNEQLKEKLAAEKQRVKQISAAKVILQEQCNTNVCLYLY